MNLPEYRRALSVAHERFAKIVAEAAEALTIELERAHEAFLEDQPERAEPVPSKW